MRVDASIGQAIRNVRHDRHLYQSQLATRMNCPRQYMTKIECGYIVPTVAQLEKFAAALEVSLGLLIRYAELLAVGRMIPEAVFTANGKERPMPMIPPRRAPEATVG
jgi:transcriptional regulator with XRE-family HTH domain